MYATKSEAKSRNEPSQRARCFQLLAPFGSRVRDRFWLSAMGAGMEGAIIPEEGRIEEDGAMNREKRVLVGAPYPGFFVTADYKRVTDAFFVTADSAGVRELKGDFHGTLYHRQ